MLVFVVVGEEFRATRAIQLQQLLRLGPGLATWRHLVPMLQQQKIPKDPSEILEHVGESPETPSWVELTNSTLK